MIARLAKGTRHGLDARSAHEWGAHLTYQKRYAVPKRQHSIQRMRQLLAQALGYTFAEDAIDYRMDPARFPLVLLAIGNPYLVFIHSTSWTSKVWPEFYWQDLTRKATSAGFNVVLPWGSVAEQQRSMRIAAGNEKVLVLPSLSISEKASVIARAVATVGLDTGFSHIAAGFNVPSVTIYGATDPFLVGATGQHQTHVVSKFECVKCHEVECSYGKPAAFKPACFVEITPDRIWQELQTLLDSRVALRRATPFVEVCCQRCHRRGWPRSAAAPTMNPASPNSAVRLAHDAKLFVFSYNEILNEFLQESLYRAPCSRDRLRT